MSWASRDFFLRFPWWLLLRKTNLEEAPCPSLSGWHPRRTEWCLLWEAQRFPSYNTTKEPKWPEDQCIRHTHIVCREMTQPCCHFLFRHAQYFSGLGVETSACSLPLCSYPQVSSRRFLIPRTSFHWGKHFLSLCHPDSEIHWFLISQPLAVCLPNQKQDWE